MPAPDKPRPGQESVWGYPRPPRLEDYLKPTRPFAAIAGALAVMAAQVDRCTGNGEEVLPQPGGFYGGWITSRVAGPFKGVPGSMGW